MKACIKGKGLYGIIIIYFLYFIFLHPSLLNSINNRILEADHSRYLVVRFILTSVFYLITGLILSLLIMYKKRKETLIAEIILIDIPIIFLVSSCIQYQYLFTFSYTKNWMIYSEIGFLLLGVELFRWGKYFITKSR